MEKHRVYSDHEDWFRFFFQMELQIEYEHIATEIVLP